MPHPVYLHKTDALRRIQHLVGHGYARWTSGTVPATTKALSLTYKFEDRYQIHATSQQRWRGKKKGLAQTHLVLWLESKKTLRFWLLVSDGEGPAVDLEPLQNARDKRSRIEVTGYELVKTPRAGRPAALTWCMTQDRYSEWQNGLKGAVRRSKPTPAVRTALGSLARSPGFQGVRQQVFELVRHARGDWQRTQRTEWPFDSLFIGWQGRYKRAATVDLENVVRQSRNRSETATTSKAMAELEAGKGKRSESPDHLFQDLGI